MIKITLIICLFFFDAVQTIQEDESIYVYESILIDSSCTYINEVTRCYETNEENSNTTKTQEHPVPKGAEIKEIVFYLNFPEVLKTDQLLRGRKKGIEQLLFRNNSIKSIEKNAFDEFDSLKLLYFHHTNLEYIDENVLTRKLGSTLVTLDLGYSQIQDLKPTAFQHMGNLFNLGLDGNKKVGDFINNGLFPKSLISLTWLRISDCNITHLDENVFENLPNLTYLELARNPLTSIPKAINNVKKLFLLHMIFSNFVSLNFEKDVHNDYLKILDLNYSEKLTTIGDCAVCNFPNLQSIGLNYCPNLKNIHPNAFGSNMPIEVDLPASFELPNSLLTRRPE